MKGPGQIVRAAGRAVGDRLEKTKYGLRDNAALITVICAIATVVLVALGTGAVLLGSGSSEGASELPPEAGEPPLTAVAQARRAGGHVWGSRVELPDAGGRVDLGVRVHNNSAAAIPHVAVRIPVPERVEVLPGSCRLGIDAIADQACNGAVAGEGIVVGELPAKSWLHVVIVAEVAPRVPGGRLTTITGVGSDQTEEQKAELEIVVAPSPSEKAVRTLFRKASRVDSLDEPPEMSRRSKRVLIARWSQLGLAPGREIAELPGDPSAGLLGLYLRHVLAGQVVALQTQVLSQPFVLPAGQGAVMQSMEVGTPGGGPKAWCFTVRAPGELLRKGDRVDVRAMPIGWGGLEGGRRPVPVTLLACPAMQLLWHGGGDMLEAPGIPRPGAGAMVSAAVPVGAESLIVRRMLVR